VDKKLVGISTLLLGKGTVHGTQKFTLGKLQRTKDWETGIWPGMGGPGERRGRHYLGLHIRGGWGTLFGPVKAAVGSAEMPLPRRFFAPESVGWGKNAGRRRFRFWWDDALGIVLGQVKAAVKTPTPLQGKGPLRYEKTNS